ncbi:phosphonate C-P lyase system protein PhnH [Rhizobium sp. KVB221]|uniref:Phosphonate C-P lyase system protein PhnH n=1 Tax=Rhizobium setariae TaxID=2801340 RepID=A0A936YTS8_9HYPH|nr:phosphonate C-P lyase system protein PhnH [Rhizobium setariae]MBL0372916.1 phosphonate C-P lyase system protein PhnH [Rhizobium setariae]
MAYQNTAYVGGFDSPVFQSQAVFKALMDGMAQPGSLQVLDVNVAPPAAMGVAAGAIALALCDHDTPVYLSMPLVEAALPAWLAFQTGALVTDDRTEAHLAFLDVTSCLPPLSTFSAGTQEYPDRSATIVLELPALSGGEHGYVLEGPGIETEATIAPVGLPDSFEDLWRANGALYPRGVDLILSAGKNMLCLPRTTRIRRGRN